MVLYHNDHHPQSLTTFSAENSSDKTDENTITEKKNSGAYSNTPPSSPLCIADKTLGSIQKSHSWFQYWLVRGIGGL